MDELPKLQLSKVRPYIQRMRPVLSREQMRAFDRHAIENCRVPSLVLMENAGRGAFQALVRRIQRRDRVLVVSGPGNNGGDGFVVARQLLSAGFAVKVVLFGKVSALSGDARSNAEAFCGLSGECLECVDVAGCLPWLAAATVVVDALFGTGLTRPLQGEMAQLVAAINASPARVFALDVPSGLDADSGAVQGAAVAATATFTFGHLKLGLMNAAARRWVGELEVLDLGVPASLYESSGYSAMVSESTDVRALLAKRAEAMHKGEAGRVLVLAGAPETLGAARLAAHGALRAGAGLVKVATFGRAAQALQASQWEVMTTELDEREPVAALTPLLAWADAVVAGPGFGLGSAAIQVTEAALRAQCPLLLDADGITHFAGRLSALRAASQLLLTPHPGEASRLLGSSAAAVEADRFAALAQLVEGTAGTVLLKGARTLIGSNAFPQAKPWLNTTGTPALATAGSGDVLSGLLGALCCFLPAHEAAVAGAWLHGRAAERLSAGDRSRRGLLAHELADELPALMAEVLKAEP